MWVWFHVDLHSQVLQQLMSALDLQTKSSMVSRFQLLFKQAWTRNGDSISRLYAGTRAMEGKGLRDGARSVQRTILNNFMDKSKNEAIEMLLFGNARSGDLGQKAVALLDNTDVLGQYMYMYVGQCDNWDDQFTDAFFSSPSEFQAGNDWEVE